MSEDISSKVKKIVADHLGIDEAKVSKILTVGDAVKFIESKSN